MNFRKTIYKPVVVSDELWIIVNLRIPDMKKIGIPSAGVNGLNAGIFSSFTRLALCRGFVCLANVLK